MEKILRVKTWLTQEGRPAFPSGGGNQGGRSPLSFDLAQLGLTIVGHKEFAGANAPDSRPVVLGPSFHVSPAPLPGAQFPPLGKGEVRPEVPITWAAFKQS